MMINEDTIKSKPDEGTIITEEEFDIVAVGQRGKGNLKTHIFNILLLILVAGASFGMGKYLDLKGNQVPVVIRNEAVIGNSELEVNTDLVNGPEKIFDKNFTGAQVKGASTQNSSGIVVGSKNSNKYHYPWCSGAKRISDENKITFASINEARSAGYLPAANCKGLK